MINQHVTIYMWQQSVVTGGDAIGRGLIYAQRSDLLTPFNGRRCHCATIVSGSIDSELVRSGITVTKLCLVKRLLYRHDVAVDECWRLYTCVVCEFAIQCIVAMRVFAVSIWQHYFLQQL